MQSAPLIELHRVVPPGSARVFMKLEWANPTIAVDSGLRYLSTDVYRG